MMRTPYPTVVRRLESKIDRSVNWIWSDSIESRVVPKENRLSIYVSSHSGCNQGCKFCWLTANHQTSFRHTSIARYADQVDTALSHLRIPRNERIPFRININFMARGEPLMNRYVVNNYPLLEETLFGVVKHHIEQPLKINISTIMPRGFQRLLTDSFNPSRYPDTIMPHLYYSIYSMDEQFRRKWIPSAMDPNRALDLLREYNETLPSHPIAFHFALIAGENDATESIANILRAIRTRNFRSYKFNIVRYNPPPNSSHVEANEDRVKEVIEMLQEVAQDKGYTYSRTRVVPRAGPDVYASCGMFTDDM